MTTMTKADSLQQHLLSLLTSDGAHVDFETAVKDFPVELRGKVPEGAPHSLWQLLEHLRIAQWDILEFSRDPKHVSPEFASGYWPATEAPPNDAAWDKSVRAFRADLKAMAELVRNSPDLLAPLPHDKDKTLLREVLVLADHNSYHLGQFVTVRRLLGAWK
jgi:hypothetical protein